MVKPIRALKHPEPRKRRSAPAAGATTAPGPSAGEGKRGVGPRAD